VAFSLDCCDREVISYVAQADYLTGSNIRDLMAQTVEKRFGPRPYRVPHPVEWLSDNGPIYTAYETREFGRSVGLLVCTTPAYSPQSNGMAEAFIKSFKRDYVYLSRLETAESVLNQLAEWFEDYNERAPHRALRMRSPREFGEQIQPADLSDFTGATALGHVIVPQLSGSHRRVVSPSLSGFPHSQSAARGIVSHHLSN